MSTVNSWLTEVSPQGNSPFELNMHGQCFIQADNDIEVQVIEHPKQDYFTVNAVIVKKETVESSDYVRQLLSANLFQPLLVGSAVAFDSKSQQYVLSFTQSVTSFDGPSFRELLTLMIESVGRMQQSLREYKALQVVYPTNPLDAPKPRSGVRA